MIAKFLCLALTGVFLACLAVFVREMRRTVAALCRWRDSWR